MYVYINTNDVSSTKHVVASALYFPVDCAREEIGNVARKSLLTHTTRSDM